MRTVHELDAVVIDQQKQLDAAGKFENPKLLLQLVSQLSSSVPEPPRTLEDDKPPHYNQNCRPRRGNGGAR